LWLYGIHTVLAAVANPQRHCRRLLAIDQMFDHLARAATAAPAARPEVERCDRGALAALLPPGAVHQGLAALVEPLPEVSLDALLAGLDGAVAARLVVLDQATDPRNVGAVIRSSAAFAAAGVVVQDRHAPKVTGALAKAAAGGLETMSLVRVVNVARALRRLQGDGFWCVGLDAGAEETIAAALSRGRVALVLGAEGHGLRRLTRETCDGLARIPIAPASGSLNLSAAAAIALYELERQ
jgi:23S rRNA (guanosine2251-2'-O)-methyltransferase